MKKARLIQPNPLPPALGTLLAVHVSPGAIQFFKQVGTVGVLRKPQQTRSSAAEEDGSTRGRDHVPERDRPKFIENDGKAQFSLH